MKFLTFILLIICSSVNAQTLTEIAASQGIDVIQSTSDHFGNGMSFYDFDEDGWDDLTFPARNDSVAFYKNNNGTFTQIGSYLYSIGDMRSILWVDYDNNGDLDLCVSYSDFGVRLYQNDGAFNFTDVTTAVGISTDPSRTFGISFADSDNDGDLDLYVSNYESANFPVGAISNKFYENLGNGTFAETGVSAGIDNGLQISFMGVWFDYDNDNDVDLHVINDRVPFKDALFENNGNNDFIDVANTAGVENNGHNPMCSSISDFDNDGYQDIFITDISNGTSTFGVPIDYKLFKNQSGGSFVNVAPAMGLDTNLYAWGALWIDYDNDGFEDLYVATSFIDTIYNPNTSSLLFHNNDGIDFTLMNDSINGDIVNSSYCPVKGDINNDGFYDLVVLNDGVTSNVLLNSADNTNNFIKIVPVGTISNIMAIGARVKVYAGGINQYQTVFCGSGLCAQNSQQMIFGLKDALIVDSLEIIFPSGIIARRYNLPVNQRYVIPEQLTVSVDIIPNVDTLVLCQGDSIAIGTVGYTDYLWNTGSVDSMIMVTAAGDYEYQALSIGNDSIIQSNNLHVVYETTPIYQELITVPICGIGNYGEMEIVYSNPADSVNTVTWHDGSQGLFLDSILPGTYSYTITSPNNCVYYDDFTISEVLPFTVIFLTTPFNDSNGGTVQFNTFGGTGPFVYTTDTTIVSSYIDSLAPGTYSIEVMDANNCVVEVEFTILDESTTALQENQKDLFHIYHFDQSLRICSEAVKEITQVDLVDVSGRSFKLKEWAPVSDRCIINTTDLPSGMYTATITTVTTKVSKVIFVL